MVSFDDVSYTYPNQKENALKEVTFQVKKGESLFITGKSGSGKSTIARAIIGIIPHIIKGNLEGNVIVNGKNTRNVTVRKLATDVGYVFQNPESQFFTLTVDQEVSLGAENLGLDEIDKRVEKALQLVGLEDKRYESVFNLSEGEKQKVALASQLAMSPEVIVMDEPTSNLDPKATDDFFNILWNLRDKTLILIDHRTYRVPEIFERVIVMDSGMIVEDTDSEKLLDPDFRDRYGLRRPERVYNLNYSQKMGWKSLLKVSNVSYSYGDGFSVEDVNFELGEGEVLGIVGSNGSGKTTLAKLITGLLKPDKGKIELKGSVGMVMQDPDHQLFMDTVERELTFGLENEKPPIMVIRSMNLQHLMKRHPHSLSGGEKQRTLISVFLVRKPNLLIMDEPTTGMDLENMKRLVNWIKKLKRMSLSLIIISHDLEFLEMVVDNVLMLKNGRQISADINSIFN
ncbi:ABC transporter ATP-binding protein [Methanothermobacter tenebrarum]|nr:energy-coupling factor transporter ATPase [Methanothermobacter tenebrarum]